MQDDFNSHNSFYNQPNRARLRRQSMSLPIISHAQHKQQARRLSWTTAYHVRLPWPLSTRFRTRHATIYLPVPQKTTNYIARLDRSRPRLRKFVLVFFIILALYLFYELFIQERTRLVFSRDELRQIWEWEVVSGHYQSNRKLPNNIVLNKPLRNPGIPETDSRGSQTLVGAGLPRRYVDMRSSPPNVAYPPRPASGSIADLDIITKHCDYSTKKYVRDCLEFLRVGAGLDNGRRVRRQSIDEWKYIYKEEGGRPTIPISPSIPPQISTSKQLFDAPEPALRLPPPREYRTSSGLASTCDSDHPRIFHIFWGGPFTSHPYTMILSFLYTQNLQLHIPPDSSDIKPCRPEFWVWMQTGPAHEANPPSDAVQMMQEELKSNPWSSPFLNPRFKDIIKFKLWNTTEQLDSIPELKDEWRALNLFKSGKRVFHAPSKDGKDDSSWWQKASDVFYDLTSSTPKSYDKMRTILSDLARFVLCHQFGGIYLDADTMFLRDWEELWGWKGAFAYRWSRLPKYNTAVLKLNKGSALGSFLIKSALRHGLDFHPMDGITNYIRDAQMENLLLRLPDALFDSAWLNTESYQRDRPPSPDIKYWEEFFETPTKSAGSVQSIGFDGFFRGAYSYHWHNSWWKPFDRHRNWPDLGSRFAEAERVGRLKVGSPVRNEKGELEGKDKESDDQRDIDWSMLLKRTFEAYIRAEQPNMYGEWLHWGRI